MSGLNPGSAPRDSPISGSQDQPVSPSQQGVVDSGTTPNREIRDSGPTADDRSKTSKRRLFGLGRKKDEQKMDDSTQFMPSTQSAIAAMRPVSPVRQAPKDLKPLPVSPQRSVAVSPSRAALRSSSPQGGSSLASSQIFERNVQESSVPGQMSPAIPSHIQTEDRIPPALEASSLAITDDRLNPDEVEIVTHAGHHYAAAGIAEGTSSAMHSESTLPLSQPDSQHESIYSAMSRQPDDGDTASTYGALDPNDVKRLSFISFADVVQAEHAETGSIHNMPMSSSSLAHGRTRSPPLDRSPSPIRSPGSSHSQSFSQGIVTPPLGSHPTSMKGLELSPGRSPVGSPQQHGELTIETMRQALRRTGSGDLSAARSGSLPVSAVGDDTGLAKASFK